MPFNHLAEHSGRTVIGVVRRRPRPPLSGEKQDHCVARDVYGASRRPRWSWLRVPKNAALVRPRAREAADEVYASKGGRGQIDRRRGEQAPATTEVWLIGYKSRLRVR